LPRAPPSPPVDHLVDQPVLERLARRHEVVALGVAGDLLERLSGLLGQDLFEAALHLDRLAGPDLDVRCLAAEARRPQLMDQDLSVRKGGALALRARGEQYRTDRHRDADAHRAHVRFDELHGVVDREP